MNEEILKRLDALGAKLGVTAQYLWGVLIKQARVEAWTDTAVCLCSVAVTGAFLAAFRYAQKSESDEAGFGMTLAALGAAVAFLLAVAFASAAVSEWTNPEYFALKHVLAAVGH